MLPQEVTIPGGSHVRFLGDGLAKRAQYVDCNLEHVVVSALDHHVLLLSWSTGVVLSRLGGDGFSGRCLDHPAGLRLQLDGTSVVVADTHNRRVVALTLPSGSVRQSFVVESGVRDVVECDYGGAYLVIGHVGVNRYTRARVLTSEGVLASASGPAQPKAVAVTGDGGVVVREAGRLVAFRPLALRMTWLAVVARLARSLS